MRSRALRTSIALVTIALAAVAATAKPAPALAANGMLIGHLRPGAAARRPGSDLRHLQEAAREGHTHGSELGHLHRQEAPGTPDRPERPGVQLGPVRRAGAERAQEQHSGALHDLRHAALGERRQEAQPSAEEDARPAPVCVRGREALQRLVRAPGRDRSSRPCAGGWPGTSRTTRSSCGRSTRRWARSTSPSPPATTRRCARRSGPASTRRTSRRPSHAAPPTRAGTTDLGAAGRRSRR